ECRDTQLIKLLTIHHKSITFYLPIHSVHRVLRSFPTRRSSDLVDRADAVLGHHRVVDAGAAEQAAMHDRVQGLDPAIHHFREARSEEHTSELQSRENLVCRLLLEKKNILRKSLY